MQCLSWTTFILERLFRVMHIFQMPHLLMKDDCPLCQGHFCCLISSEIIGWAYTNSIFLNKKLGPLLRIAYPVKVWLLWYPLKFSCSSGGHAGEMVQLLEDLYLNSLSIIWNANSAHTNCTGLEHVFECQICDSATRHIQAKQVQVKPSHVRGFSHPLIWPQRRALC